MPTVLILDDDPMIREMLTMLLQMEGYEVVTAANGVEGMAQLHHQRVDLVLSDLQMPELDGITFYKHLRTESNYHTLPFILMSALPPRQETLNEHMVFLPKPLDPATLLNTIAMMMNQTQGENEREAS